MCLLIKINIILFFCKKYHFFKNNFIGLETTKRDILLQNYFNTSTVVTLFSLKILYDFSEATLKKSIFSLFENSNYFWCTFKIFKNDYFFF